MGKQTKKRTTVISFLMIGALFCSIMVALTTFLGAEDYAGLFAIAAVGFAIITVPFSVIVKVKSHQATTKVSRVDLLRKRLINNKPLRS
ncbi:MAG: hypothetical protein KAG28_05290 [Cocleimonas sp.]|nr:hypothetical protein [Cocleimonas sp.]